MRRKYWGERKLLRKMIDHGADLEWYKPARWIDRGLRTVALDDDSIAILLKEKEKHLRMKVGVPDAADVDLSLVRLPDGALMFPNVPDPGEDFSFTASRNLRIGDDLAMLLPKLRQAEAEQHRRQFGRGGDRSAGIGVLEGLEARKAKLRPKLRPSSLCVLKCFGLSA